VSESPTTRPSSRDRHLFTPGPKRILSLDGGGVRGAISIGFLEKLEKVIEEIEGKPTLLGDWFDLIGGTSTGAIIAGALALGYRAAEVRKFYELLGPRVFRRSYWRVQGLFSKFDRRNLIEELEAIVGSRKLDSDDLHTGLCIVAKRLDTGSSWVIANNPKSQFWDTPADASFLGNRHYLLNSLIRASAAAPYFFDPEFIEIIANKPPGMFIDGALTPHNNPALQLFLYAALPQYGLAWPLGADKLTVVSVGTGFSRPRVALDDLSWIRPIGMAVSALQAQIGEAQQLVLTLMSWLGQSPTGWPINSELGDVTKTAPPFNQPFFRFLRYDIHLEQEWIARELGVTLDKSLVQRYERIDAPDNIPAIYQLAARAAELQVKREDLAPVRAQGS
jgi:predicted acylesterase/phospholipase RssA